MKSDVIFNKISVIERCLKRIREEYNGYPKIYKIAQNKIRSF
ncbi:hypothetical protein HNR34_002059 [Geobacillus subterraneus]